MALEEVDGLVAALGDSSKAPRAAAQLSSLISSGGAATLLEVLLARLCGPEPVKGAGGQRLVAKLLSEATYAQGVEALHHLPKIVEVTARALGDGEATVRDAFAAALAEAARNTSYSATGKELVSLLIRPLLRLLDQPNRPLQHGTALAVREVVRVLQPEQLRPAFPVIVGALRKHLRSLGTHGRPALLECAAELLHAVPESAAPFVQQLLPLALQGALVADWHERLAAVNVLHKLVISGLELQVPLSLDARQRASERDRVQDQRACRSREGVVVWEW